MQQQQEGAAAQTALAARGSHLSLSIDALESAQATAQPPGAGNTLLPHTSSGSSGSYSSRNPGSISTTPAAAGKAAAAAVAAAAAAAAGPDESSDQLGPLALSPQQHKLNLAALQRVSGAARLVPVGIITLEDVIEELMQVGFTGFERITIITCNYLSHNA
jgi:hypothetical protein